MEAKTIIAIALVAFIVGGFIFLQVKNRKKNLSIEETAAYTGIGRDTIYKLIKQDDCNFTLRVGKRTMIKRKRFEEYLEKLYSI